MDIASAGSGLAGPLGLATRPGAHGRLARQDRRERAVLRLFAFFLMAVVLTACIAIGSFSFQIGALIFFSISYATLALIVAFINIVKPPLAPTAGSFAGTYLSQDENAIYRRFFVFVHFSAVTIAQYDLLNYMRILTILWAVVAAFQRDFIYIPLAVVYFIISGWNIVFLNPIFYLSEGVTRSGARLTERLNPESPEAQLAGLVNVMAKYENAPAA